MLMFRVQVEYVAFLLSFLVPLLLPHLVHVLLSFTSRAAKPKSSESTSEKPQAVSAPHCHGDDSTPCRIKAGLFLGSVAMALNKSTLKHLNVTHILSISRSIHPAYPNDFVYKRIKVADKPETKLEDYFDRCFRFIDKARSQGGGVLVHCYAGRSRSVTIVVAYLMKRRHMSLSDALSLVKRKRPTMSPNYGFVMQLQKFEKSLGALRDANSR